MFNTLQPYRKTTVVSPSELVGKLLVVKVLEYLPAVKTRIAKNGVPGLRCNVYAIGETEDLDEFYFNVLWTHRGIVNDLRAYVGTGVAVRITEMVKQPGQTFLALQPPTGDDFHTAEDFISDHPEVFEDAGVQTRPPATVA